MIAFATNISVIEELPLYSGSFNLCLLICPYQTLRSDMDMDRFTERN